MIKTILFDFDGTLANTAPGIVKTMEHTFLELGVPVPEEDKMRATIGLPLNDALQRLGELSDSDAIIAGNIYRRLFPIYEVGYVSIFEGVRDTLERLAGRGLRLAIVTSRGADSLDMILEHHGLKDYFETRVTISDNLPAKPAPDMVYELLHRMDISSDEALVVGDTTYDIEMGNRAGCVTCAVTYGNHPRTVIEGASPSFLIDSFAQLVEVIDSLK